jgi:DNA-binding PadR family transcriptional regulator
MIDQDIKKFVLRRLLQKNGEPATATELKLAIRSAFAAVFTEGDLDNYIAQLEDDNYVAGTRDDLSGTLWALTPKGKIKAQQIVKK